MGATFRKTSASRTGGRSINGSEQVVGSGSGFWSAEARYGVHREMATLAWRGFYASVDGMATEFLVPVDARYRPYDENGRMLSRVSATSMHDERRRRVDGHEGWGWANTEPTYMWTLGDAARRGTRLIVRHPRVVGLRPGHYFGIGDRLYLVARTWQLESVRTNAAGGEMRYGADQMQYGDDDLIYGDQAYTRTGENVQVVEFWPHLRAAVPSGTPLILGRPVCRMRFASDDTGALDQGAGVYGTVTLDLAEVI